MEVFWLPKALEDLKEIKKYTSTHNPASLKVVAQKIKETISLIKKYPFIGKTSLVEGFREASVSGLPFTIPYKVLKNKIIIVRVFHARQDNFNLR